jgi:hypothetical protein
MARLTIADLGAAHFQRQWPRRDMALQIEQVDLRQEVGDALARLEYPVIAAVPSPRRDSASNISSIAKDVRLLKQCMTFRDEAGIPGRVGRHHRRGR